MRAGKVWRRSLLGHKLGLKIILAANDGVSARRTIDVTLRRPVRSARPVPPVRVAEGGAEGGWPLVGISDHEPTMFADPLFRALRVGIARMIVPWNVLDTEPERLDAWLYSAHLAAVEPMIVLEHARRDQCPASPCRLPSADAYAEQVRSLLRRYPWVQTITPWNEPNHVSQPTAGSPRQAARYYNAARDACANCTLVAGDLLDASNLSGYLDDYRGALAETPKVWGVHNYFDTTHGLTTGLETMLEDVRGEVWLSETGGIVSLRYADGRVGLPHDTGRAARAVHHALVLADAHLDRVTRVYLHEWRAPVGARFDGGLLARDGTPRPGYWVLARALANGSPPPAAQAGPKAPGATVVAAPRLLRDNLRVTLRCADDATHSCVGTVTVESARWQTALLVNGRPRANLLGPRSAQYLLDAGRRRSIDLRVPRRGWDRTKPARLRIDLSESDGARAITVAHVAAPDRHR
jgi:hypothetical protein